MDALSCCDNTHLDCIVNEKCEPVGSGLYHRATCGYSDGDFAQGLQAKPCLVLGFTAWTDICSRSCLPSGFMPLSPFPVICLYSLLFSLVIRLSSLQVSTSIIPSIALLSRSCNLITVKLAGNEVVILKDIMSTPRLYYVSWKCFNSFPGEERTEGRNH